MALETGSAVTIGAYDGVHIGHRLVIELVRRRAADLGLRSVVVTFDKNPAAVVNPASAPPRLTDIELKMELLGQTGVDQILVLNFDVERAKEPAEDFVNDVLVGQLAVRVVVVGDDFHFGNQRRGNVELLRTMGSRAGFSVEPVHLVSDVWAHLVVSSTRIRGLIAKGELDEAHALLGRAHEVRGHVIGSGRPDATGQHRLLIEVAPEILLPPPGEYLGAALTDDKTSVVAARIVVPARASGGHQHLEIFAEEPVLARSPFASVTGRVVRARFA
ncbi:MAG: bifunctional riboflavin kinase/FAD synthetase [Acidimicrobiales bacterium]